MKRILLAVILGCFFFSGAQAQQVVIDPVLSAAIAAHAAIIESQMKVTKEKLTLIERGQLAVTGQLGIVNVMQDKIFKGLSQVDAVLMNVMDVQDIAERATYIAKDVSDAVEVAKGNPALLLFAEANAREFYTRATKMALEVSGFVLKGGKENLMDSGERAKLLRSIREDMMILRGVSYGMVAAMKAAKARGIFRSLNPFQNYISLDNQIMDDILSKYQVIR